MARSEQPVTPLVSILIPCHNAARWLGESLESALAQTHPECEIIVVDDGSSDHSLEIARSYGSRGVLVATQPNLGASAARNHAFRLSKGAFIQYLDADDILDPGKVAAQISLLQQCPPDTLSSGHWIRFSGKPGSHPAESHSNQRDLSGVEFLQLFYEKATMMQPGAWLSPRGLLEKAGPWDEFLSVNDDGEYFARVMLRSSGIRYCPEAIVYYRSEGAQTLSRRRSPAALRSVFRATELITGHLLAADRSQRSLAAAAYAWKWTAFELLPEDPALSREAESRCHELGGSNLPYPAGPRLGTLAGLIGWRRAKQLRNFLDRLRPSLP